MKNTKKPSLLLLLLALLLSAPLFGGAPKAAAQEDEEKKQIMYISYPGDGIILEGKGEDAVKYKGTIYVKVYPITPRLKKKYGDGPIYSNEIVPSLYSASLPYGEYEVHFSMRVGAEMRTCIKRQVIVRSDDYARVTAEMDGAKNLIIGGTMTAQQMEAAILQMQKDNAALRAEIDELKKKAKP